MPALAVTAAHEGLVTSINALSVIGCLRMTVPDFPAPKHSSDIPDGSGLPAPGDIANNATLDSLASARSSTKIGEDCLSGLPASGWTRTCSAPADRRGRRRRGLDAKQAGKARRSSHR